MRKFRRNTIPERAHPLVRELFREMNDQRIGLFDVAERAGLHKNTLQEWRTRTVPKVSDLEACFNVVGRTISTTRLRDCSEIEEE